MNIDLDLIPGWGTTPRTQLCGGIPQSDLTIPGKGHVDLHLFAMEVQLGDEPLLSEDERARAQRLIIPEKQVQSIAARAMMRRILSRYLGEAAAEIEFDYDADGKPRLRRPSSLSFNLSHSDGWALLGVTSGSRLGVDLEHARRGRAFEDIAERFFAADEQHALKSAKREERPLLFYRAWTQKEAYLKAWGTGLRFPSSAFSISMNPNEPPRITATSMPGDHLERWHVVDLRIMPTHAAAICNEAPVESLTLFRYQQEGEDIPA